MERMIIYSDNEAVDLLFATLGATAPDSVFRDLQVVSSKDNLNDNVISVKDYSSFFRILYNASYLNKQYSEKALHLLSKVTYKDGLVAGVPNGITVSHKFGERPGRGQFAFQLHDCGIVYYPNAPYLLCVMTRGNDNKILSSIIAEISTMVYQNTSSQIR
jgi:beta-lactamase class A